LARTPSITTPRELFFPELSSNTALRFLISLHPLRSPPDGHTVESCAPKRKDFGKERKTISDNRSYSPKLDFCHLLKSAC
jgi:hypothetical protein